MSRDLRQHLRLVFRARPAGTERSDGAHPAAAPTPWVQFVAFTEDCLVSGHIQLDSERLSDTLNAHLEYLLCDVLVESLEDGHTVHTDEVPITRNELLAVLTDGSRGNPTRRIRTVAYPVTFKVGPYLIRGNLHSLPGMDPLASARRRRPMIPLSDAWIEYRSGGITRASSFGTIVVNRATADWIQMGFAPASVPEGPEAEGVAATEGLFAGLALARRVGGKRRA